LIFTYTVLRFQALKEKEEEMVENGPTENPLRDHCEGAVDVEIARIASENLTAFDGQGVAETVVVVIPNDAD
jgi:hypothetical protein